MPNWVHRIDKTTLTSVAEADLPEPVANYIEDPVLPAAKSKYWDISGDTVSLMDATAQAVVDAAEKDAQRDSEVEVLINKEDVLYALFEIVLSEVNILRVAAGLTKRTVSQMRTAVRKKLGS